MTMKINRITILSWLLASMSLIFAGCIRNDIPYPRIQPGFASMEAKGLLREAEIDSVTRTVTLTFNEETDIRAVEITSYTLTPDARLVSGNLDEPVDLSEKYVCTLALYQDYDWTIQGVQNIERYFTVENQIGASEIDVENRTVKVTVPSFGGGFKAVKVLTMKLGPTGCTVTPSLEGETVDLSRPVEVTVTAWGRTEVWTISAEQVDSNVNTVRVDPWTNVAWVYGTGIAGVDNGVEYRLQGTQQWTRVPREWLTVNGGEFHARIINLKAETAYEARAYGNDEFGETLKFTTGGIYEMPNRSFDQWSKNGAVWQPWGEGETPYWDTGNKGAATLGDSNVVPTNDTSTGKGKAAMLQTKFVGIGPLGKLAAGSIYAGTFKKVDGTNGILGFGRPIDVYPTRLQGYFTYKTAPINKASNGFKDLIGEPDTCVVWCALIDSPEPFESRTNPKNQHLFDPDAPDVIAYGKMQVGYDVPEYTRFEVELKYNATDRHPKYLLIVAAASKYGDYFTGGEGAVMCVDDFELLYDY